MEYSIVRLTDRPDMKESAAGWFHEKWGIPEQAYLESMEECLKKSGGKCSTEREAAVPQWYLAMEGERIIGGMGVIENDFHDRPDLRPNLCALYVEEPFRGGGIAGEILSFVRVDMAGLGVKQLYLVTDHTDFYERYGWNFLTMVCDASGVEERMYTIDCV